MHALRTYTDLYERDALNFIFSRTRLFNKEWERIPLRHFLKGVTTADGHIICAPVDITKRRLLVALRHLEAKGLIEVQRHPVESSSYRVRDVSEIDPKMILEYMEVHQKDKFDLLFGRVFERQLRPSVAEVVRSRILKDVPDRSIKDGRWCDAAPTLGAPLHQPAGAPLHQHKYPIPKKTRSLKFPAARREGENK